MQNRVDSLPCSIVTRWQLKLSVGHVPAAEAGPKGMSERASSCDLEHLSLSSSIILHTLQ